MNNYNNFSGRNVPSFSVLEENIDSSNEEGTWKSMYENNLLAPTMIMSPYEGGSLKYDTDNYIEFKGEPVALPNYGNMMEFNNRTMDELQKQKMSNWIPDTLPEKVNLPNFSPPWGTPYPSAGYSSADADFAYNSGITRATARPSLPVGTMPSLVNAQNNPSVALNPQVQVPGPTLTVEKIKEVIDSGIKEHYGQLSNQIQQTLSCAQVFNHAKTCPICTGFMTSDTNTDIRTYRIVILILILVIFVLFILALKKKR